MSDWAIYARAHRVDFLSPRPEDVARFVSLSPINPGPNHSGRRVRRPGAETTRMRLVALTKFFDWTCAKGIAGANPARGLPRPPVQEPADDVRRLTPEEIASILKTARHEGPLPYAAFRVLADLGVRGVELQRAHIADFRPDQDGGPVLHTIGRGRQHTIRRMPDVTVQAVKDALAWRRSVAPRSSSTHLTGPLLAIPYRTRQGPPGPLDADRWHTCFRRIVANSGITSPDTVTPHAFRHAWVRHGVAAGWAVTDVQAAIGHRSLSSTLRYLVGGVGALHPLAAEIRPITAHVADSVVLLRAVSGGEDLPVVAELEARRHQIDDARNSMLALHELAKAREEAADLRIELNRLHARYGIYGRDGSPADATHS